MVKKSGDDGLQPFDSWKDALVKGDEGGWKMLKKLSELREEFRVFRRRSCMSWMLRQAHEDLALETERIGDQCDIDEEDYEACVKCDKPVLKWKKTILDDCEILYVEGAGNFTFEEFMRVMYESIFDLKFHELDILVLNFQEATFTFPEDCEYKLFFHLLHQGMNSKHKVCMLVGEAEKSGYDWTQLTTILRRNFIDFKVVHIFDDLVDWLDSFIGKKS